MAVKTDISVIIPIFRNEQSIGELLSRLSSSLRTITEDYEIIFVNDGSPDNSWDRIVENARNDPRVKGIRFSRNFGQHIAITAGVKQSCGEWIVVMDGDLQDRPEEIVNLCSKAREGYDVVFARRRLRKDNFPRRVCSRLFYKLFDLLAGAGGKTDAAVANFGIFSRKVIDNFNKMQEHSRFFPLFVGWLGFKTAHIDVEHEGRRTGRSAYTFKKKIDLALDAIVSLSNKPLKISIKLGLLISIFAFLYGVCIICKYLFWGVPVMGWTSLMVSLYFIAGLLLSTLGVLGIYLGKIFDEVKNRPLYIIAEKVGGENGS